ncbi:MAG TPA: BTAD domain-containing putative transcriptional regulator [Longimicrobiales bacterium]|nr:BTAD domain-containing putative transcriptional regulator [Longimicrobiales bacterium]
MYRLRCFGYPAIEASNGARLEVIERHPKRFAVLIYLAGRDRVPRAQREALLPVFWPDSDEPHARNALRQSIFCLREFLGPGVLIGRSDGELSISPERFHCDLWDFRERVRARRWDDVCAGQVAEFLQDFVVRDAEPFMDWIDAVRLEVATAATQGWAHQARAAEACGDYASAATAWEQALALSPHSEAYLRQMVSAYVAAGDRAAAADAYDRFERRLAVELDLVPTTLTYRHVQAALGSGVPAPYASSRRGPIREPATAMYNGVGGRNNGR